MSVSRENGLGLCILALLSCAWTGIAVAANVAPSMLKIEQFNAERGDAQSQYFMGEHYELGDSGLKRDLDTALQWYRKAAEQGHAAAEYRIGRFHENGHAGLSGGMDAALAWYRKAAAGGNEAARLKLEAVKKAEEAAVAAIRRQQLEMQREQRQQAAQLQRQREQERARMLRANKPPMAGLPLNVPQRPPANNPPEETLQMLLASNWSSAGRPAEYLPASDMSCLKSGDLEVTCFSRQRQRVVGNSNLQFSVKSVIDGFSPDGSFKASYFYNVAEIDKVATPGSSSDPYGLKVIRGWQQPGHEANCRIRGQDSVACDGNDRMTVQFDVQ